MLDTQSMHTMICERKIKAWMHATKCLSLSITEIWCHAHNVYTAIETNIILILHQMGAKSQVEFYAKIPVFKAQY